MMKILGVIPTIYERRDNLNIIIEKRAYKFLRSCFTNYRIIILDDIFKINPDLIVSLGGNTLNSLKNNKSNKFRAKLDKFYLKKCIKKKIPFLGICHGAQSIANLFKMKLIKKEGHANTFHSIRFRNKKTVTVNSYHNFSIIKIDKNFTKLAWSKDGSIEAFRHIKHPILGIMWHPERYQKIKNFDKNLIKKYL